MRLTTPATGASEKEVRRLAPLPLMVAGAVAALLMVLLALLLSLNAPWLGLTLDPDGEAGGLTVTAVDHGGPSFNHLVAGDELLALEDGRGRRVSLIGYDPRHEPTNRPTYAGYNQYIARQGEIYRLLGSEPLYVVTADDRRVALRADEWRPLRSLPVDFWLFNLFGMIAWVVGLAVWAFRRQLLPARLLCLSGLGFFLATFFNSLYLGRELALDPLAFHFFSRSNHAALTLMLGSLLALLAYYPRSLLRRSPGPLMALVLVLYQINENLQWIEWPLHTFYLPIMALYLVGLVVAAYQWRLSRYEPLDRAALKWVLLSIFIVMGMGLLIYFVPIALTGNELFSQTTMVGIATLLYIGFALGVIRYRLFDLERWWLRIWAWFLGGLAVVVFDLVLMYLLGMQPAAALAVAVIAVGWIYFPLRQWVWGLTFRDTEPALENSFANAVEIMSAASSDKTADRQWRLLLTRLFDPLAVALIPAKQAQVEVVDSGAALRVPALAGDAGLQLEYAQKGRRLFNSDDLSAARGLLGVCRRIINIRRAEQHGARVERARIMRDLHDDVGGHILSLLRNAPDERSETLARNALKALREAMQAMDDDRLHRLDDALDDWQAEALERCQQMGFTIDWQQNLLRDGERRLSPRQYINIKRILSEGLTNTFKYGARDRVEVITRLEDGRLELMISNPVETTVPDYPPRAGRGLHHIRTRVDELGGSFEFTRKNGIARLHLLIPLQDGETGDPQTYGEPHGEPDGDPG